MAQALIYTGSSEKQLATDLIPGAYVGLYLRKELCVETIATEMFVSQHKHLYSLCISQMFLIKPLEMGSAILRVDWLLRSFCSN